MQLRWYVWPMPIKLALCSICMALMLYQLAGAPTRSKEKTIASSKPRTSSKKQSSTNDVPPTSTEQGESLIGSKDKIHAKNLQRGCYNMTLTVESIYSPRRDSSSCRSASASDKGREQCKRECDTYALTYKQDYLAWVSIKRLVRSYTCLQSKRAGLDLSNVSTAVIGSNPCDVQCKLTTRSGSECPRRVQVVANTLLFPLKPTQNPNEGGRTLAIRFLC
ncbi:hypothetical protein BCR37DRAFT_255162 [Protomyces lactucae-debilis]|uniref:Uncharacterized protein n=1 Tax=Protomyces lactucae-debilis TaxID=2754530 RepID=A0A1Y2FLT2_PROLT|nr:uncharacterized protein BCR37DRAFT_255162 [Protomyces lactucae-debilis]ORY84951.1 hypothetical protein BCR37DRAFT_255162 [Protomyces lactucae-debilis]